MPSFLKKQSKVKMKFIEYVSPNFFILPSSRQTLNVLSSLSLKQTLASKLLYFFPGSAQAFYQLGRHFLFW